MKIYWCSLTLQDPLFYATREMGRLYETEKYLHNYGLTYAFGLISSDYHTLENIPRYREDLLTLNERGIYLTPAKPTRYDFSVNTFKFADVKYHVEMEKPKKNIPTFGRAKELAPESQFECFIFSNEAIKIPKWIRLGKWMSKACVHVEEISEISEKSRAFTVNHPLNPLDIPNTLSSYDLICMPPVSLIYNARLEGDFYEIGLKDRRTINLPKEMKYFTSG